MRLLGDRVSRATAFRLARELDLESLRPRSTSRSRGCKSDVRSRECLFAQDAGEGSVETCATVSSSGIRIHRIG